MSVNGPIARTVEDAALFDVTASKLSARRFVKAAARKPGRLRIALSAKLPPTMIGRVGRPQQRALDGMEALLRTSATRCCGATSTTRPGRCTATCSPDVARDLRGRPAPAPSGAARAAHQDRRAARQPGLGQSARQDPGRRADAGRPVGSIFDDVDVLITPEPL